MRRLRPDLNLLRATPVVLALILAGACSSTPTPSAASDAGGYAAHLAAEPKLAEPFRSALDRQNEYRKAVNLPAVTVDPALSAGAEKHARYLIKNKRGAAHWRVSDGRLGAGDINPQARDEAPANPWFTPEGAAAARSATVLVGPEVPSEGAPIIDQFMSMPFSTLSVLDPQMNAVGAGVFCEEGECAAVWTFRWGLRKEVFVQLFDDPAGARWNPALGVVPIAQAKLRAPVQFPPPGGTTHVLAFEGNDAIEVLNNCAGYEPPTGAAILLMAGKGSDASGLVKVGDHSLSNSGGALDHCVFDASSFINPDRFQQDLARRGLARLGAIIMIPRTPLVTGERYDVSITADSQPYSWSFTAGEPTVKPRLAADLAGAGASGTPSDRAWLQRVNYYRVLVALKPVTEDATLSKADLEHARYMAKNRLSTHRQDPANRWHTAAGDRAARASNVSWGYGTRAPDPSDRIDGWIEGPFHRLPILNPDLRFVGFGYFSDGDSSAAALNVQSAPPPRTPLAKPIMFPPSNSTVDIFQLTGETPNPLTSCTGYKEPSGLPVTLQLGEGVPIAVTAHSFASAGKPLDHCVFDAANYTNSDVGQQQLARSILRSFGAIVLIPRAPLRPGANYDLSITVSGQTYAWAFTVVASTSAGAVQRTTVVSPPSNDAAPAPPIPNWLAQINSYRAMESLPPAAEDASLTDACFKHARYVLENHSDLIRTARNLGHQSRQEDPANPWFSESGAKLAPNLDMAWGCGALNTGRNIERSIASVFHRFALLDPKLTVAALGAYEKNGCWVMAIRLPVPIGPPKIFDDPVEFPPNGSTLPLESLSGEWPDPLSSCPGYGEPAGLPLSVQFGRLIDAQLASHSITENGRQIEHCAFDARSYVNPDAAGQEYGRWALKRFGAVALVPREPLHPGAKYDVAFTTKRGKTFTWSFAVDETNGAETAARSATSH